MEGVEAEVWNSATVLGASESPMDDVPAGMRHLARLLRFHNAVMGGGLSFALEITPTDRLEAAAAGADYLDLPQVAEIIRRLAASDLDYDLAEALNDPYYEVSGEMGVGEGKIEDAFLVKFAASPQEFGRGALGTVAVEQALMTARLPPA